MDKPIIVTKKSLGTPIILIIGFVGSGIAAYFLIKNSFSLRYYQIGGLIGGLIFGLFSFLSLISVFLIDNLKIFTDRIVVFSTLGFKKRIIHLKDINKWVEIEKKTKYTEWKDLIIFYGENQYKISSSGYKNYNEIKYHLTKGKRKDESEINRWQARVSFRYSIFFILFGIFVLYGAYWLYNNRFDESDKKTIRISGVLDNMPKIERGSKSSRKIHLRLKEYPEFVFSISGIAYSEMYASDYVNFALRGDSLFLTIYESVAEKKLWQTSSLGYLDKHYGWDMIRVYGLSDKKRTYLVFDDYAIRDKRQGLILFLICIFVGIGFVFFGLYELKKLKPTASIM